MGWIWKVWLPVSAAMLTVSLFTEAPQWQTAVWGFNTGVWFAIAFRARLSRAED